MEKEQLRKNISGLHFQKYLIMAPTSVLIAFTYSIGVNIAFITKQIKFNDLIAMFILFISSAFVISLCLIAFFPALIHIRRIPKLMKDLK